MFVWLRVWECMYVCVSVCVRSSARRYKRMCEFSIRVLWLGIYRLYMPTWICGTNVHARKITICSTSEN